MLSIVLIILLVGAMEVARVVWVIHTLDRATQESARYRYTDTAMANATLQTTLQGKLTTYGMDGSVGSCSEPTTVGLVHACVQDETVSGASYVAVQAQYRWEALIPFVPATATLTRTSRVPK